MRPRPLPWSAIDRRLYYLGSSFVEWFVYAPNHNALKKDAVVKNVS